MLVRGGASTITQQLAKMLFTEKPATGMQRVLQKLKEWVISVQLEKRYTKKIKTVSAYNRCDIQNFCIIRKTVGNQIPWESCKD